MPGARSDTQLIEGLLTGDRLSLARAISRIEDDLDAARSLLPRLFPHTGAANLIGVTGAPGTGKSTLVAGLARLYREKGRKVAILAVDPTSPFSGGALLGDRVRMTRLSGDPGLFIRSMATRGTLGGLARAASDALLLLDAAGYERILIETVGVGQAEVEIASVAHTTVVVEAPGLGDEVQAIKAGILEIGDIFLVNKSDRPGAKRTVAALEMMLQTPGASRHALHHALHHGELMAFDDHSSDLGDLDEQRWNPQVLQSVAVSGGGIEELHDEIERHATWLTDSGERAQRERRRFGNTIERLVQVELLRRVQEREDPENLLALVDAVQRRETDPHTVARTILERVDNKTLS